MKLGVATLFALVACTPSLPPPTPFLDASDAASASNADAGSDIYTAACANLFVLHCPEGATIAGCAATLRKQHKKADYNPTCVAGATSVAIVRGCSSAWTSGCPQ